MREIKFRAYSPDRGLIITQGEEFVDGILGKMNFYTPKDFFENIAGDYTELMQYTGLKDKNGVEIFEGDIINCDFDKVRINWDVQWHEFNACFVLSLGGTSGHMLSEAPDKYEVVGNIYENPELVR